MSASPLTPADKRALVAIDLGAESCRVSLLTWILGKPVLTLVHRFANAPRHTADGLRWDLTRIEAGLDSGLRKAAELAPDGIRSIAVDGWAVDYVRIDSTGKAVADPYCYRDERTVAAERTLHAILPADRMRDITGIGISRIDTLYQLYADTPAAKQLRWLNLPEYILHRLGARAIAEYTNATHTQMIDLATKKWSEEIVTAADLNLSLHPEIVSPGTKLGHLTGPLTSLPAYADTALIAPAAHDTASAIAGIPASGDDWAYISSGTWSLVGTLLKEPKNTPEAHAENLTNLGAAGGLTCFHRNVNGLWLLRQSIDYWATKGNVWTAPELVAAAEQLSASHSLFDVNEDNLLLPGDMPLRINAQLTARGTAPIDAENPPLVANLIFHSLAACYAQVIDRIGAISGKKFSRIFIVGGGSQNLYLNRLTERATGLEVIRRSQESSTIGNFAVQLATLESPSSGPPGSEVISAWAAALADAAHL